MSPRINFHFSMSWYVQKEGGRLHTSVYRKSSFSGLGTSFFSFISRLLKYLQLDLLPLNGVFRISSSYSALHSELEFVKGFFQNNGFPLKVVYSFIQKFLDFQCAKLSVSYDVPKLRRYFVFPYFDAESDKLKRDLSDVLMKFSPYLNPVIVLMNTFPIGSLFRHKDRLPKSCQSSVVYQFCCASCGASYAGSALRNLHSRIQQHLGKSVRTGMYVPFQTRPLSDSRPLHACDTLVTSDNFSVLGSSNPVLDLRILESLYVFKNEPSK